MTSATRSRLIIVTAGAGALIFFLHLLGALNGVEGGLMRLLSGPEARITSATVSIRRLASAPFTFSAILAENATLKKERDALLIKTADTQKISEENDSLRAQLSFAKLQRKLPLMANVLAVEPEPGTHAILIDKGTDDGVVVDQPVVAENGIMVGKILKTDTTTSVALLLSDSLSRVGATVNNASKTQGIVRGLRGLSLEMGLIPQNQEIAPGDLVVTSGIEPLVPKGLVIGQVQEVNAPERNPFKTAGVTSPVSYDRLEVVGILVP